MDDITTLLVAWGRGDEAALEQLIPLVHRELHQIARRCLKGERPGHTLQPTALVYEAYLKLVDVRRMSWKNRISITRAFLSSIADSVVSASSSATRS